MPRGKTTRQSKLTDFSARSETQHADEDMAEITGKDGELGGGGKAETILAAIGSMKIEFISRFDDIAAAIENMRKEINDCLDRVSQAEVRLSNAEDEVINLQARVKILETNNKSLEDKVLDLESRSRMNNLRLVNLPEGTEGRNPCSFLGKWIPEVLGLAALQPSLVLERAHRIGPMKDNVASPRTLIIKFLNYEDRQKVLAAVRDKKDIRYKDQKVWFYPDIAAGIHHLRKQFDPTRQVLRDLGIRHGMIHPAKLLVTHKDRTYIFKTPAEAQDFVKKIQKDSSDK